MGRSSFLSPEFAEAGDAAQGPIVGDADMVKRVRHGFRFQLKLACAASIGKRFAEYRSLLHDDQSRGTRRAEPKPPSEYVTCVIGRSRRPSDLQRKMLTWITSNQPIFVGSVFQSIRAYYAAPAAARWKPGADIGPVPPPPEIPKGYYLEEFTRLSRIFLNERVWTFGVVLDVAWSDARLGVRFGERFGPYAGGEIVAWF